MRERPEKIEFLERIGSGGMAEVYKARLTGCAGFAKTVVVKRLKKRYQDIPAIVKMFVDEARLSAEVQHKNIVQVFEFLEHGGELLIVMEYVPGTDLRGLLKRAAKRHVRVPVWLSLHVMAEVLEGLIYAHTLTDDLGRARGIIHRDVAPDNVFLSGHGDVKLGDFGIAHQGSGTAPELNDHIKGKLPYMAPELFESRGFDQRVDVFAASVCLWECLTQRRLFKRKTNVEMIRAVCLDRRVPPSRFGADIPPELDRIVLAGLEVDARRRIPSTLDLQHHVLDQLQRIHPTLRHAEVRSTIRSLIDDPPADADDLVIDVVEEVVEEDEPIIELSPWDVISDSGVWATPTPTIDTPDEVEERTPPPMVVDHWASGNYAIVRGTKVDDTTVPLPTPPIPAPPGELETREIISIPGEPIPMPGEGGAAETGDILRTDDGPHTDPFEPPYRIRSSGMEIGPMSLEEASEKLRSHLEYRSRGASISADGDKWMPTIQFLELTGQEVAEQGQFLPRGSVSGSLSGRSVVALLGEMARQRVTGRLVITQATLPPALRREVHFFHGEPTYVSALDPELQPAKLLIDHGLIGRVELDECMRSVIREHRPLDYVLSRQITMDVDRYRAFVMTMRLETIFDWSSGHFAFDAATPPVSTRPFAESVYALLPLLVARKRTTDNLDQAVRPHVDRPYTRSQDFDQVVSLLQLSVDETNWVRTIGQFKRIGDWLSNAPDERQGLIVAHLLVELGLLRQAKAWTGS